MLEHCFPLAGPSPLQWPLGLCFSPFFEQVSRLRSRAAAALLAIFVVPLLSLLPRPCCQPKSLCSTPFPPLHCIRHYLAHVDPVAARPRTRVNHWLLTTSCRPTDPSCKIIKRLAKFRDPKTSSATKRSLHLPISIALSSQSLRRLPVQSLDYHTASSAARFNALKPLCRLSRAV